MDPPPTLRAEGLGGLTPQNNMSERTTNFNFNINICSYWSTRIQTICRYAAMQTGFSGGRRNESSSFHRGVSKPGCISAYLHIV